MKGSAGSLPAEPFKFPISTFDQLPAIGAKTLTSRAWFATLLYAVALLPVIGCGSSTPTPTAPENIEDEARKIAMVELFDLLKLRESDTGGKPATKAKDLARYEILYTAAYPKVRDGEIVLTYGAKIDPTKTDTIIAYEKVVPEAGGYVLMQDGATVKKLTAEEFKAAPKAEGSK